MPPRLYIKTWGCQMNEYDSARMADVLAASRGFERTEDPEAADVLLLNTCSVREKAQEKVFSQLGRWREWKQDRPDLVIGVGGCVASQEGDALLRRAPFVDLVFGPQTVHRFRENEPVVRRTPPRPARSRTPLGRKAPGGRGGANAGRRNVRRETPPRPR